MDIKMSNQVVFWCVCIGYAEFYSRCILVEDGGIFVTLLAHRKIPGVIPQVAAFQLHLLICSENQQCPKPSVSPSSSRHRKTTLNLYVALSHSWKMHYWKLGNLCSSKRWDVMAAVEITGVPQRQSSAMFGLQQPGQRRAREATAGQVRHQKHLYLICGLLDKLTFYQPLTWDKAAFKNIDVKTRSWVVILWFK